MNENYLWEKLGPDIQRGLMDSQVFEITLNPDGGLWFLDRLKGPLYVGQVNLAMANAFVHALAHYREQFLNADRPYLDTVLPFDGERINVTIPPIVDEVSFNIRKKATVIFTLEDYMQAGILTDAQAFYLANAVIKRKNILISGGPGSGKTTFANALLAVIAKKAPEGHRVLLLEQVSELQCAVKNVKRFLISEKVTMNGLLWLSMRNSPDRIVVGEVRDGAALDMLKAWNTGCQGGVATIHANSPQAAVQRVLDLSCEATTNPPYSLTAEALDVIVQIEANADHSAGRLVTDIVEVTGFDVSTQQFLFKPFITHQECRR